MRFLPQDFWSFYPYYVCEHQQPRKNNKTNKYLSNNFTKKFMKNLINNSFYVCNQKKLKKMNKTVDCVLRETHAVISNCMVFC